MPKLIIHAEPVPNGDWDIYIDGVYWRRYRVERDRLRMVAGRHPGVVLNLPTQAQIEHAIFPKMKGNAIA